MHCTLLGVPVQSGSGRKGCNMGPNGLRAAGLAEALAGLGHEVDDIGDLTPAPERAVSHPNTKLKALSETVSWIDALSHKAYEISKSGVPIFMGGDHVMAAASVAGVSRRAHQNGRPLFVLWLDAHTDFHTLESTVSGNLVIMGRFFRVVGALRNVGRRQRIGIIDGIVVAERAITAKNGFQHRLAVDGEFQSHPEVVIVERRDVTLHQERIKALTLGADGFDIRCARQQ